MIVNGTRELSLPMVASTMTTTIVFLPLVFIDPEIRQIYIPFALTITFALIASVISTLIFVPAECFYWQNNYGLDFQHWYLKVRDYYRKMLVFKFKYQTIIWACVLGLLVFSAGILLNRDSEFIDPGDINIFRIGMQFPPATKIEVSNEIVKHIEKALLTYPNVRLISSRVEKLHTFIEIEVKQNPEKFKEEFRKRFPEFAPAFVYFQESQSRGLKRGFDRFLWE